MTGPGSVPFQVPDCSASEQQWLIALAHEAISRDLQGRPPPEAPPESLTGTLAKPAATFVTLTLDRKLRGCVGHLIAREPLYRSVMNNAVGAASRDHRFGPVTLEESFRIKVHISLLSTPVPLPFRGVTDLLDRLTPGIDGVVLRCAGRTATYLPQVWESIPDKIEFLDSLCRKAGLASSAWKEPGAELSIYRASGFGDAGDAEGR